MVVVERNRLNVEPKKVIDRIVLDNKDARDSLDARS